MEELFADKITVTTTTTLEFPRPRTDGQAGLTTTTTTNTNMTMDQKSVLFSCQTTAAVSLLLSLYYLFIFFLFPDLPEDEKNVLLLRLNNYPEGKEAGKKERTRGQIKVKEQTKKLQQVALKIKSMTDILSQLFSQKRQK